jgi:hypothetical protein
MRAALVAFLVALAACGAAPSEAPAVDGGSGCDADPCAAEPLLACPVGDDGGDTHVRDDIACTCSCSKGWPR